MATSRAARVGGAGLLALVATYGIGRQAFGLFVPAFRDEFGAGLDAIGGIASAAQLGYLVATLATGVLTARTGPRRPIVLGCVLLAVGAAIVATATSFTTLAIGVVLAGTSAGGTWAPFSDAVDAQVRPSKEQRALALVNAGAPIGLVVASVLVLVTGASWRAAWWAFAAIGVVAAIVNARALQRSDGRSDGWPAEGLWAFVGPRSARLFAATFATALTSGAYFAYAPDTVRAAGLAAWSGPAMWAVLGLAGGLTGVRADRLVERAGTRRTLRATLTLLVGAHLLLLAAGSLPVALTSAALFGVGFTIPFAVIVMWSQDVFADRPTDGFTATIVCLALGFAAGPAVFGLVATHADRPTAVLVTGVPALLALLAPPRRDPA